MANAKPVYSKHLLKCQEHGTLERMVIDGSEEVNKGKPIYRYVCTKCYLSGNGNHHIGYECPLCGLVKGSYYIETQEDAEKIDPAETLHFRRVVQTFLYRCSICNT
ncbi:hypothetical protein KY328_04470, partial [Candidatus Woesearchaeota archaeon]|nr:hypothetical protein [Candidatus Woesearchaeota archaeon]